MLRRNFLSGLAGILAAGAAPAIVHNPMKIFVPKVDLAKVYADAIEVDLLALLRAGKMRPLPIYSNNLRRDIVDDSGFWGNSQDWASRPDGRPVPQAFVDTLLHQFHMEAKYG